MADTKTDNNTRTENNRTENENVRNVMGDATTGFAEFSRDYLNKVAGAWGDTTERWNAASQRLPAFGRDFNAPNPKELVDASYDIIEQMIGMQRELAHRVLDRFGSIVSDDERPAQDKMTDRVNENARNSSNGNERNSNDKGQDNKPAGQKA